MADNNNEFKGINICGMKFSSIRSFLLYLLFGPVPVVLGVLLLAKKYPSSSGIPLSAGIIVFCGLLVTIFGYATTKPTKPNREKAPAKISNVDRFKQQSEKIDTVGAKTLFEIWEGDKQKVICKRTADGRLFYWDVGGNGSYINSYYGKPEFRIVETGRTEYTYHPSQYYYVGATVGGITTGGVYKTQDSYSSKRIEAESGFICCDYKGPYGKQEAAAYKFVLNDELAKKAAETDVVKDYLKSKNTLQVLNKDPSVSRDLYDLMNFSISSGANSATTLSIKSRAEAAMFAPLSDCRYCLDFINKILE